MRCATSRKSRPTLDLRQQQDRFRYWQSVEIAQSPTIDIALPHNDRRDAEHVEENLREAPAIELPARTQEQCCAGMVIE